MPLVKILLVTVVFLSLMIELKTGGTGFGAMLGIASAGVFFGSHYVRGLVDFTTIAIFLVGIVAVSIEILTPGTGIMAAVGLGAMFYSFILALGGNLEAVWSLCLAFFLAAVLFIAILKFLPSSRLWRRIVLTEATATEKGYVSTPDNTDLLGQTGTAETDLRPAGKASLPALKKSIDVVTNGEYIKRGEPVIVASVIGGRIVVRRS